MTRSARGNLILGGAIVAVTAVLAFLVVPGAIVRPQGTESRALSPDFWPLVILGAAAVSGACMALGALVRPPADGEAPPDFGADGWRRIAAVFAGLAAFYLLTPVIGMAPVGILLALFLMWLGGERRRPAALATAVLLPLVLHLFFVHVAQVPLPMGIFEDLF